MSGDFFTVSGKTEEYSNLLDALHLGHYVQVIQDAINPVPNEEEESYMAVCMFRALWALHKPRTTDQAPEWSIVDRYESAEMDQMKRTTLVNEMKRLLASLEDESSGTIGEKYSIFVAATTLYLLDGRLDEAYSLVQSILQDRSRLANVLSDTHVLEAKAILVYIFLSLKRLDLAREAVDQMKEKNEFSVSCLISEAMLHICAASMESTRETALPHFKEAIPVLQELMDTYGRSSFLYNLEAICYLQTGDKQASLSCLEEAHRLNGEDEHVLANLSIVSSLLDRPNDAKKYIDSMSRINPNHSFLVDLRQKSELFDRLVSQY